jgi:hypothetical protein
MASEAGLGTTELCRKHAISEQTIFRWKAKCGGVEVSDAQRLRQLEDENRKLKHSWPNGRWPSAASRRCSRKSGEPAGQMGSRKDLSRCSGVLEWHACGQLEVLRALARYRRL